MTFKPDREDEIITRDEVAKHVQQTSQSLTCSRHVLYLCQEKKRAKKVEATSLADISTAAHTRSLEDDIFLLQRDT